MKKALLAIFGILVICSAQAQNKSVQKVEKTVESFRKALVEADSAVLHKLLDTDLTYGHSGGKIEGKASLISSLTSGESDFVTMDLTEQTVLIKGNIAVVRHILTADTNDYGKPGSVKLKVLMVWHKVHGQWLLLARQAVKAH